MKLLLTQPVIVALAITVLNPLNFMISPTVQHSTQQPINIPTIPHEKANPANDFVVFSQDFDSPKSTQSLLTNSSMQVVSLEGKNWLQLGAEGSFTFRNLIPDTLVKLGILRDKNLPQQFTFEVEAMATTDFVYKTKELATVFAATKVLKTDFKKWGENRYDGTGVKVGVHPIEFGDKDKGQTRMMKYKNGKETQKVEKVQRSFSIQKNRVKIQFIRDGEQLQVFLNGDKQWDVADAFDAATKYNTILFTTGAFEGDNKFYITNLKLSVPTKEKKMK